MRARADFERRPLRWLHGEIQSPPFSEAARNEAGRFLRRLQYGGNLGEPYVKPVKAIHERAYELRIRDENVTWRILFRADDDAIVIVEVFAKKTPAIPQAVIQICKKRLRWYDAPDDEN